MPIVHRLAALGIAAIGLLGVATGAGGQCTGDCDGDGQVAIGELIAAVNIALGLAPLSQCVALDADGSGTLTIQELIAAVNAALSGCPATPTADTPTPNVTAAATASPTPPATATPPPTVTDTITVTASATPAASDTATPSPSATRTATDTASATATGTDTPSAAATATGTATQTPSPTATPSASPTSSPSNTATVAFSVTPTATASDTQTAIPTDAPTATPPPIPSDPPTATPTLTPTASITASTRTATGTPTASFTPPPAATATFTPTATPTMAAFVCGNGFIEPGETCGTCAADCTIGACTATATMVSFQVHFEAAPGTMPTTATTLVGYRSSRVSIPGTANATSVRQRVTFPAPAPNVLSASDLDYAIRVVIGRTAGLHDGLLYTLKFDTCQGAPAATAADFACTMEACAGSGGPIAGCTCTVAAP